MGLKLAGKTVWITGASSGIGLDMARQAVTEGASVILSGRNEEKLAQAQASCNALLPHLPALSLDETHRHERVSTIPLDVSDPKAVKSAVRAVAERGVKVDILVNNAGVGQSSLAIDTPLDIERQVMETNYWGCIYLTKEMLPLMRDWGGGQIAVMSSVVGLFGFPLHSSYVASKHALQGYFSSLAPECKPLGIKVTLLCPGRIATPFARSTLRPGGKVSPEALEKRVHSGIRSETCARLCWRAIHRGTYQQIIARIEWLPLLVERHFPNAYLRLLCWAMRRPKLKGKM